MGMRFKFGKMSTLLADETVLHSQKPFFALAIRRSEAHILTGKNRKEVCA